jgi:hypothetical protein
MIFLDDPVLVRALDLDVGEQSTECDETLADRAVVVGLF